MDNKFPFTNLVFEGGGVKGIAYAGALKVLEDKNILSQVDRVAGTSAGAITAALVAMKYDADQIDEIVGSPLKRDYQERAMGDARHTAADVTKAKQILGYQPKVSLREGLEAEWNWIKSLYA